jgi:hypothetical protein
MIASVALAFALIVLLVKVGKIDLRVTLHQLRSVSLISFAGIAALNVLLVYHSTEKWSNIDAAWRHPSDSVQPGITSHALTSIGPAVGIFLPMQLAMAPARTLGTYFNGRALKRGTGGTLLKVGFDAYTIGLLAVASGITWFSHGRAIVVAVLAVGPLVRTIRWLSSLIDIHKAELRNSILRSVSAEQQSGILNAALARQLVALSALRRGTVVLMSSQTAEAVGIHIPIWQIGAAIPLVSVANTIALTHGGIRLNDLAGAGALEVFGTSFATGAQWVLANCVLVSMFCFLFAVCAAIALGAGRTAAPVTGFEIQEDNQ